VGPAHRNNDPLTAAHRGDGFLGRLVIAGLLALTVCMLFVFTSTTLTVTGAAPIEESNAALLVYQLHPHFMRVGAAVGILVGAASLTLAVGQLRQRRLAWSLGFLLAGGAAVVASRLLILGAWAGDGVEDLPQANEASVYGSLVALAAAAAIWTLRCWWTQQQRIAAGEGAQAEARTLKHLRLVDLEKFVLALPAALLPAVLVCLLICTPVSWWALSRATDYQNGLAAAIVLSDSGVTLFCLLQCAVLVAALGVMIFLARAGWLTNRVSVTMGALAGAFAFIFSAWGLSLSFGSELQALGLTSLMRVVLLVVALFYGAAFSKCFLWLCGDHRHPRDLGDFIRIAVLAGVLIPLLPALRWLKRPVRPNSGIIIAGCAVIALVLAGLIFSLFPEVEDFLDRIRFLMVALIVLFAALLGFVVDPPKLRLRPVRSLMLIALLVGGALVVGYSKDKLAQARPRVFGYDPLGKYSLTIVEKPFRRDENRFDPPPGWIPPELGAPASARRPVMDELRARKPLIILIIWDAARKDHISLYGYQRANPPRLPTTPHLDAHREEFLRFDNAFSQATATTCAMRHLFTGRYSSRWMTRQEGIAPFWTDELITAGYDTFFLNIIGTDYNGLSLQAFYRSTPAKLRSDLQLLDCPYCPEHVLRRIHEPKSKATAERLVTLKDKPKFIECNRQNERASADDLLALLQTRKATQGSGVFAYIHMDLTHTPWYRREDVEDFGEGHENRYDENIRSSDLVTGHLIQGLKQLGMWDNTLLIVTADHGTGLADHGVYGGFHPHREQISVPLVVKIPGVKGAALSPLVGLIDIGPTLLDIFAPEKLAPYEGRSLWPVIFGDATWDDRVLFGLSSFANCYYQIRADGWHYIRHRGEQYEQLYNWRQDPAETANMMGADRAVTKECRTAMDWFLYGHGDGRGYTNPYHYREAP